jgi:hypothetical protein
VSVRIASTERYDTLSCVKRLPSSTPFADLSPSALAARHRRLSAIVASTLFVVACEESTLVPSDSGRRDVVSADVPAMDASARDVTSTMPPLPCDARFEVGPAYSDAPILVSFTDTPGYTNVGLRVRGPGAPVASWGGVRGSSPFTWSYTVTGAASGVLEMTFVADPANQEIARCSVWVREGPAPDVAQPDATVTDTGVADARRDGGACRPNCRGVPCGGDDGCGTPCSGSHRDAHGAVSDCRAPGDCGCGVEDNGNMVCGDDGQCVIRCSCDCLPPQRRPASAVARLDRAGACLLVFRESGDPTVWDAVNGRPLCPLAYDPVGAARCSECPPCHRNNPPECGWDAYCTCRDPRWIGEYRNRCCAAGAAYCF